LRRLAEQDDPCVPDSVEQRIDISRVDTIDWFSRFSNQLRDARRPAPGRVTLGFDQARLPALSADQGNELNPAEIFILEFILRGPRNADQALQPRRIADRNY